MSKRKRTSKVLSPAKPPGLAMPGDPFAVGDRVVHVMFGRGTVESLAGVPGFRSIIIDFDERGRIELQLSFCGAKLQLEALKPPPGVALPISDAALQQVRDETKRVLNLPDGECRTTATNATVRDYLAATCAERVAQLLARLDAVELELAYRRQGSVFTPATSDTRKGRSHAH